LRDPKSTRFLYCADPVHLVMERQASNVMAASMFRQPRLPILLALACALFLRALVPAGWMPAASGGAFAIEPCPAAEAQPMVHMADHHGAMPGDHGSSHQDHHGGDACFSALLIGFAPVDQPASLPACTIAAAPPGGFSGISVLATGPPALLPPATGPPAIP
jgi:hypothetical protein